MCMRAVFTQVTAGSHSVTGPNPARCRVLSIPCHIRKRGGHTKPIFLYQKELDSGLASAFLTYLNNHIGQPDIKVRAVVMDLLLLT